MQTNLTIHIAIAYLERLYFLGYDKIIDKKGMQYQKSQEELRKLTVTCLLLASKYDELDDRIPFINDLINIYKNVVKIEHKEVIQLETQLLFTFDFDLMILTPLHFVYSLVAQGVVFADTDSIRNKKVNGK